MFYIKLGWDSNIQPGCPAAVNIKKIWLAAVIGLDLMCSVAIKCQLWKPFFHFSFSQGTPSREEWKSLCFNIYPGINSSAAACPNSLIPTWFINPWFRASFFFFLGELESSGKKVSCVSEMSKALAVVPSVIHWLPSQSSYQRNGTLFPRLVF